MFQFKIQLKHLNNPKVWRRVAVPEQFTFDQFHEVIIAAFGWRGYHLYQFSEKGYASQPAICIPNDEYEDEIEDSSKLTLSEIFFSPRQKFVYIYDFGDDWYHNITLEKIKEDSAKVADCIAGGGACPPEDCGGFYGYLRLQEILSNPKDPEYAEMKEWLGLSKKEKWDADIFDLERTSKRVQRIDYDFMK